MTVFNKRNPLQFENFFFNRKIKKFSSAYIYIEGVSIKARGLILGKIENSRNNRFIREK